MRLRALGTLLVGAVAMGACGDAASEGSPLPAPSPPRDGGGPSTYGTDPPPDPKACAGDCALTVRFYDAGQALSALVTLPDGRQVLVDTGESPQRPCSGCRGWHDRVMTGLRRDLGT